MVKSLRSNVFVFAIVLLAACGGTDPVDNSFTVAVSGDTTFTFDGEAVFGTSTAQGTEHWVIFLSRGTFGGLDFDAVAIGRHGSATPIGVGTHTIADATGEATGADDIDAVYALRRAEDGSMATYSSVSGSLTISSANEDEITGEFSFNANFVLSVGAFAEVREVTLTGSFTAIRGNVPSIAA